MGQRLGFADPAARRLYPVDVDVLASHPDLGTGNACPAVYDLARHSGWPVRELRRDARTLETVFNQLATGA